MHLKQKYIGLLTLICEKIRYWFDCELSMAEKSEKYPKASLIRDIIEKAK